MSHRVIQALGLILLICLSVRIAAWVIEPILPALGVLVVFAIVGSRPARATTTRPSR